MRLGVWAASYNYWGELDPTRFLKGQGQLGGGETAALHTAMQMAVRGHEVVMAGNTPDIKRFACNRLSVVTPDQFLTIVRALGVDALIAWDSAYVFRWNLPSKFNVLAFQLNDADLGIMDWNIDEYWHPSNWHAERFAREYGVNPDKQRIRMTNATTKEFYNPKWEQALNRPPRAPWVVWASSPDRGLHHLLRIWPLVREQKKDAQLHIFYDMHKWLDIVETQAAQGRILNTTERGLEIKRRLAHLGGQGVFVHGGVNKVELESFMLQGSVLAYPCDPVTPTEGFSMTILDAASYGMNVLTTDADALPELWSNLPGVTILPLPVTDQLWAKQILEGLKQPHRIPKEIPDVQTWSYLATKWEKAITARTR